MIQVGTATYGRDVHDPEGTMNDFAKTPAALEATAGSDLDFVLERIAEVDPINVETEDASAADWAVHKALTYVRAEIARRRAVLAGPDALGAWCGVDDAYGRACGAQLGLPDCRYHARRPKAVRA